jgi:uncharacterized RDD family membrane protein YckC
MEDEQIAGTKMQYAGFGKRMAAMLIDRVIISVASTYAYWEINREVNRMMDRNSSLFNLLKRLTPGSKDLERYQVDNISYYILSVIFTLVLWCYYAGMESSPWRGTIGKKLVGLEVSDMDGSRISFTKATGRYFGKIISIVVLGFGYLAMLFNEKKQTWHDSMSGCVVKEK